MKFSACIVAVLLSGCSGLVGDGTGVGSGSATTPEELIARKKFETDAYPIFANVCSACHGGSLAAAPPFVMATSIEGMREKLLGYDPQVINTDAPESSRVLNKGAHNGTPALDPTKASAILGWIQAEHDAAMASPGNAEPTTDKFDLLPCTSGAAGDATCPINTVKLDSLGLAGASITFIAQQYGNDTYVSDLYVQASADGVYLDHPLFVSWPATGTEIPDTVDRFNAVKHNLAATKSTPICPGPSCDHIGPGAAAFIGFPISNQMQITFKTLDKFHADTSTPPPPVGCGTMGFASFLTNVKPNMSGVCASCHGGANQGAKNAMDLSGLASTTDNNACLQVRAHIDTNTPASSPLLLAPQMGQDAAHPAGGKLSAATNPTITAFQTAVTTWINVEINEH